MRSGILLAAVLASALGAGAAGAQVTDYVPLNEGPASGSPQPDPMPSDIYPNVDGTPSNSGAPANAPTDPTMQGAAPGALPPTGAAPAAAAAPANPNLPPLDIDRVMDRVKTCWTAIPVTFRTPAQGGFARIRLKLTPDGALDGSPMIIDKPAGPVGAKFAESAAEAIRRCQPYKLPQDRYAEWRMIEMRFDTVDPDNPPPAPPLEQGAAVTAAPTPGALPPAEPAPAATQSTFDNYVPSVPAPQ